MMYERPEQGDIRRQIVLPLSKSVEIAFKSLKVRFSRSLITVGSLVLAVSFLAFVLINLNIATGLVEQGTPELTRAVVEAGFDVDAGAGTVQAGAKERWIVLLSLLVCAVGIINAQLMSVTERFREIGIYKCLGALDSMILRLFLLEAAMMGLAGAAAGSVLGLVFALLSGTIRFGFVTFAGLGIAGVAMSMLKAMGAGVILSLIGVFYPALLAARMRPINALRAEH